MLKECLFGVALLSFLQVYSFQRLLRPEIYSKKLTDRDIVMIYDQYLKPHMNDEYANRYVPLPMKKNHRSWRWEGKDLGRVIALLEFERFVVEHSISFKKGLAINGLDPEWRYLPRGNVARINYEANPEMYDLHTLDLGEKDFDFVMINQTLEHVYDPILCLANIYEHMSQDGILYINVPVTSIPHTTPFHHYTGYTPVGLGMVVKAAGFRILSIGQWGNLEYLRKMYDIYLWPDYRQLRNPGLNDFRYPVIAWIFATKE